MESVNNKKSNSDYTIENLIEKESKQTTINSTISAEDKESSKKDNDYIEVLGIWKKEKHAEQIMKIVLCSCLGALLVSQIVCINIIIFKIGFQEMKFDEWTIRIFVGSVFAEIVALVKIIVNNLFPESGSKDFMEFINNFYCRRNNKIDSENK